MGRGHLVRAREPRRPRRDVGSRNVHRGRPEVKPREPARQRVTRNQPEEVRSIGETPSNAAPHLSPKRGSPKSGSRFRERAIIDSASPCSRYSRTIHSTREPPPASCAITEAKLASPATASCSNCQGGLITNNPQPRIFNEENSPATANSHANVGGGRRALTPEKKSSTRARTVSGYQTPKTPPGNRTIPSPKAAVIFANSSGASKGGSIKTSARRSGGGNSARIFP